MFQDIKTSNLCVPNIQNISKVQKKKKKNRTK